ncbi:hypothetical protein ABZ845_03460 [Streptomyces sp. NPDC047022]|uniref:hypothetical protein n=1 Tax=Streptomyces sp. NPDC047022 TaxID=3155737 RepID=UPI0033F5DDB9
MLSLLATGCGIVGPASPDKEQGASMNMQEAAERADHILDDTFSAIKPPVEWTYTYDMPGGCYVDRSRSVMTIISPQRRGSFLGLVERHWKNKGYKLVGVSEDKLSAFFLTPDNFQLEVTIVTNGQADFGVTTPCVEKSPVAPPAKLSSGPDYSKRTFAPAPNVHSDFWSAETPVSH